MAAAQNANLSTMATNRHTYFAHLTVFVAPPLAIDSIVPKKERFSAPQFGHGP